jgi:hypothetical protein
LRPNALRRVSRTARRRSIGALEAHGDGLDLTLAERAPMHRARRAQCIAGVGQGPRAQVGSDVDHRDPGARDRLVAEQDEVGVAVAVGVDALDVGDLTRGACAFGQLGGTRRRLDPRRGRIGGLALGLRGGALPGFGRLARISAARLTDGERQRRGD